MSIPTLIVMEGVSLTSAKLSGAETVTRVELSTTVFSTNVFSPNVFSTNVFSIKLFSTIPRSSRILVLSFRIRGNGYGFFFTYRTCHAGTWITLTLILSLASVSSAAPNRCLCFQLTV